jgi:hypothetical protein
MPFVKREFVYQVWHETEVGPIFSSEEKAISHIEAITGMPYDPDTDYPHIRKFDVDTGFISLATKKESYDR